jgi:hypothetical protein
VERCVNKLRAFRAVATRYDKRECIYQGTGGVAWIRIWLRDPVRRSKASWPSGTLRHSPAFGVIRVAGRRSQGVRRRAGAAQR